MKKLLLTLFPFICLFAAAQDTLNQIRIIGTLNTNQGVDKGFYVRDSLIDRGVGIFENYVKVDSFPSASASDTLVLVWDATTKLLHKVGKSTFGGGGGGINKVDSITVRNDSTLYWINGTAYWGGTLIQGSFQDIQVNSGNGTFLGGQGTLYNGILTLPNGSGQALNIGGTSPNAALYVNIPFHNTGHYGLYLWQSEYGFSPFSVSAKGTSIFDSREDYGGHPSALSVIAEGSGSSSNPALSVTQNSSSGNAAFITSGGTAQFTGFDIAVDNGKMIHLNSIGDNNWGVIRRTGNGTNVTSNALVNQFAGGVGEGFLFNSVDYPYNNGNIMEVRGDSGWIYCYNLANKGVQQVYVTNDGRLRDTVFSSSCPYCFDSTQTYQYWGINGNANTTRSNFFGTVDSPFVFFRVAGIQFGKFQSDSNVTALGDSAAWQNLGNYVNAIGYQAAYQNSSNFVNAIGYQSAYQNSNTNVNAIGVSSAYKNSGVDVNSIGVNAAYQNTGNDVNAFGLNTAYQNIGNDITAIGSSALSLNSGNNVIGVGQSAASTNTGNNINALGYGAAYPNTGNNLNALGDSAGAGNTGNDVNAFGNRAAFGNTGYDVIAIGDSNCYNNTYHSVAAFGDHATPTANYEFNLTDQYTHIHAKLNNGASGTVLTNDGSGNGTWAAASGGGNSSPWDSSTTTIFPYDLTKKVGIGMSTPTQKLEVNGQVKCDSSLSVAQTISIDSANSGGITIYTVHYQLSSSQVQTLSSIPVDIGLPVTDAGHYYAISSFHVFNNSSAATTSNPSFIIGATSLVTSVPQYEADFSTIIIPPTNELGYSLGSDLSGGGSFFAFSDDISISNLSDAPLFSGYIDCEIIVNLVKF